MATRLFIAGDDNTDGVRQVCAVLRDPRFQSPVVCVSVFPGGMTLVDGTTGTHFKGIQRRYTDARKGWREAYRWMRSTVREYAQLYPSTPHPRGWAQADA